LFSLAPVLLFVTLLTLFPRLNCYYGLFPFASSLTTIATPRSFSLTNSDLGGGLYATRKSKEDCEFKGVFNFLAIALYARGRIILIACHLRTSWNPYNLVSGLIAVTVSGIAATAGAVAGDDPDNPALARAPSLPDYHLIFLEETLRRCRWGIYFSSSAHGQRTDWVLKEQTGRVPRGSHMLDRYNEKERKGKGKRNKKGESGGECKQLS